MGSIAVPDASEKRKISTLDETGVHIFGWSTPYLSHYVH